MKLRNHNDDPRRVLRSDIQRNRSAGSCPEDSGRETSRNLLEFLAVLFFLPRLAWGRVSDHLFRWTQLAHMTDSALDQLEGQPGLLGIGRRLRAAKSMMHLSGRAFPGSRR